MSRESHVHIVPAVPPAFNGLSDYCYKLWQHWPQPRPAWTCLSPAVPAAATATWLQATLLPFELNKTGLLRALNQTQPDRLILHYVGYAYNRKGVPLWLPAALAQWKRQHQTPICVMFHELWASGSPRQSAFWLQPLTKNIVVQLAKVADSWITSSEVAAWKLIGQANADAARGHIVPIGSAIEPQTPVRWERPWPLHCGKKLRLAIFGLPSNRMSALRAHRRLLELLIAGNFVESVVMIGKSGDANEAASEKERREEIAPAELWQERYDMTPAEISPVLADCHAALTHYPPDLLTKSSVYPAFCLHDLITICQQAPPLVARPKDGQIAHLEFQAPHIASTAANAGQTVRELRDLDFIPSLRAAVKRAAHQQLSWSQIIGVWQKALA